MDFGGSGMEIFREDPEKYRELMKTASKRDLELWTDELLDGYFEKLEQPRLPSEERSCLFSKITGLLCSSAHPGAYLSRLIGDFPLLKKTETFWKIVILETVAGRTASLKDGLIAICAKNCTGRARLAPLPPSPKRTTDRSSATCGGLTRTARRSSFGVR